MTATSYYALQLLFLGTFLISATVLCRGAPVLDTDGNPVKLTSDGANWEYLIRKAGSRRRLAALHRSTCESYVMEARTAQPGVPVEISEGGSSLQEPYVEVGSRYRFTFRMGAPRLCHTDWLVGDELTTGGISFKPILAGDIFTSNRSSWFEVRSTETKGVYKLAACPCKPCKIWCPEVSSFVINGTTVLGVDTVEGNNYTVRFVKSVLPAMKVAVQ